MYLNCLKFKINVIIFLYTKIGRKTSESFFASLYGSLFLGFFRHFDRCQIDLACDSHWPHDSCTCNITAMDNWAAGVCTV